uniref:RRM domain-containing protein n=1 Tax=Macrostomum lignano TaxID=282301 RepID=A0A1I8I9Q3_9PLAT
MKRPSVPYSNGIASAMPAANAGHWTSVGQWPNAKRPCQSVPTAVDAYRQNLLSTDYDHHNHLRHSNQRDQHSNQPSYHANSLHGNQLDSHPPLISLAITVPVSSSSSQSTSIATKRVTIATSEPELSPILASDLHQSPVVHVSNLAPNTTEAALLHSLSSFGVIRDIVVLPSRATAYVQFNDILAAQTAVAASRGNQRPPTVHGQRLRLQYCRQPGIDHAGALDGGRRSRVLLLVLTDLAAGGPPVTAQLLRQAAS